MNIFNPDIHRRRSVRLKDYEYSKAGAYFVTICTWDRGCLFGDIGDEKMRLNEYGQSVQKCWDAIPEHFPDFQLDEFIVMPNHIHGIIVISDNGRGMACHAPTGRQFSKPIANSLSTVVGSFKSAITKRINKIRDNPGCSVWQRNYYEHVIRSDEELNSIRQYITENPLKWELDEENPVNIKTGGYKNGNDSRNQRGQALHRDRPSKADAVGVR